MIDKSLFRLVNRYWQFLFARHYHVCARDAKG